MALVHYDNGILGILFQPLEPCTSLGVPGVFLLDFVALAFFLFLCCLELCVSGHYKVVFAAFVGSTTGFREVSLATFK